MVSLKQADRLMQFTSPLGKDVLLIESISGSEAISTLFDYQVELLAPLETTIDPTALVGAKASVAITLNDVQGSRWVNGIISTFEQCAGDDEFNVYKAHIVPAMWQLNLSSNCRVFQNKTVLDIVKAVIGEYGLSISDQTSGTYKQLEYCTQYSETDFYFISRLMQESGIFYWFEHTDQDNKIMLGDSRNAYQDCPLSATVPFALNSRGAEGAYGATVTQFTSTATMVSGKHSTADYTFRTFARADTPDKNSASPYGKNAFDQYLYPAGAEGYVNDATQPTTDVEAQFLATRTLSSDSMAEVLRGSSNFRSLCAGYTFTMTDNPRAAWNRKYLLTSVSFSADQVPAYRATDDARNTPYTNQFTAVSSDIVYMPPMNFGKPKIYGPQTALVVGPSGEEIYLDDQGRVKVQFFWDRLDSRGATTNTTWVRVAQSWAGNGWGTYFWPRVNDEVVIQFLNGDPDNPVITGSVYNSVNTPPFPLPDNGTRSGIMTRSSKGGSASNSNQLRFEDKKGSEQIYVHAEKDMDVSIENDRRTLVNNNDSLTVTGKQTEQIQSDFNRAVQGNLVEKIGGNADLGIGGNQTESVGGNHSLNVSSNQAISVGSAYSLNANNTIYINGGMSVVIQAGMELSLVASGNFVTIGPAGVAISGTMVLINSGGAAGTGSAGQVGSPQSPASPDKAENDDGNSGSGSPGTSTTVTPPTPPATSAALPSAGSSSPAGAPPSVADAANQAAQTAQQAAGQAQQAANQAAQDANSAANGVMQDARKTFQQAQQGVQQAKDAVANAAAQGKALAQQALSNAEQQLQQCAQAGALAAQQAQQAANQIGQQVQKAAKAAQDAAQQAETQANKAISDAKQGATQAAQQALAGAKDASRAAQNAANSAESQAKQAQQQVQSAAGAAQQQAQQASQAAQQSAGQAANQATRGF